jgi:hypothetical protein
MHPDPFFRHCSMERDKASGAHPHPQEFQQIADVTKTSIVAATVIRI